MSTALPRLPRLDVDVLNREAIDRAISTIEDSRATHVDWAEWRRRGNTDNPAAGDEAHHRRCIAEYDHVLTVLRAVRRRWDSDGRLR